VKPDNSITDESIGRAIVRLSVPIILANILQTAYGMTDTYWVGWLNKEAVAAVTLSFPLTFLLVAIGGGLPIAGTVLIAQYRGRGDSKAMNHVTAQTMLMVFLVSLVMSVGGYFLSGDIIRLMNAPPEVYDGAVRFLQMTFLGFLFVFGFMSFQSLMRGLGVVYMPMLIVLLTVILNFGLDPLFIWGWGPFPAMGVSGAAMATLCTQALATLIAVIILLRGNYGLHVRWRDLRPDFAFIRRVFWLGLPASIEQSSRALGMTVMTMLVTTFGTIAIASYGVGMRVLLCVLIPAMGLSMATSTLVGHNIGAGRMDRALRTNFVGCLIAVVFLFLAGFVLFFTAESFSAQFVPKAGEAIEGSAQFIRILAFSFWLIGIQQVLTGTFRGAGDMVAPMLQAIVFQWVLQFPLAYVLSKNTSMGLEGIWWSFNVTNVLATVITLIWYWRGSWRRKRLIEEVELENKVREETMIEEGSRF
jgi:putative MATE family efflux protein